MDEVLETPISPFEGRPQLTAEVGADLFLSSQDHPQDFLTKASQSDSGSKGDHLIPKVPLQVQTCQGKTTQFFHPLLLTMGMNTSLVNQTLPLEGRLRYFLTNWRLLTRAKFILKMIDGLLIPLLEPPQKSQVPSQTSHNQLEQARNKTKNWRKGQFRWSPPGKRNL